MSSFFGEIINKNIYKISFKNYKKNSMSPAEFKIFESHLDEIIRLKTINSFLFVSANKNFFCAGGDLTYYSSLEKAQPGIKANQDIARILTKLNEFPLPTAVCVEGLCVGGGVEFLSCFDFVVASNASIFSLWQRKIGLSYGWGGFARLKEKLSGHNLKKIFLSTEPLSSYEAMRLGLIDKIVPSYKLESVASDWLVSAGHLPVASLKLYKDNSIDTNEQGAFEKLWLQPDHQEALAKFMSSKKS